MSEKNMKDSRMPPGCPHPSYCRKTFVYVMAACAMITTISLLAGDVSTSSSQTHSRPGPVLPVFLVNKTTNRFRHGCYERGIIKEPKQLLPAKTLKQLGCRQRPPNAIVFGVKKGGTTALKEFLAFHPDVTVTPKELHFLSNYSLSKQGIAKYASMMPFSLPNQIAIEKTPAYFVRPKCPERLKPMIPDCKLIAILTDPILRAISDYVHMVWTRDNMAKGARELDPDRRESIPHYEVESTFRESVLYPNGSVKTWNTLVDSGLYFKHTKNWLRYFPSDNLFFLDGNELVKRPVQSFRELERFLKLSPFFSDDIFHFNRTKGFYCIQYPLYSCMPSAKGRPHPVVEEDVIRRLQVYYEPYNIAFSKLVKKTFSWTRYSYGPVKKGHR